MQTVGHVDTKFLLVLGNGFWDVWVGLAQVAVELVEICVVVLTTRGASAPLIPALIIRPRKKNTIWRRNKCPILN